MPSPSILLPRPALAGKILAAARAHSLTVVIAPTGYGKTTLARSALESAAHNVWYYSVPGGPHDAPFLWHDMFGRFEAQGMAVAPALLRLGFPESASQRRQALALLRGLSAPTCLIVDDYHQVADTAMSSFWERAVRAALPNFRLVLFSRVRPDISLEELRIKGLAAVFEQDALAFSEDETRAYFLINGLDDAAAAAKAQNYSEGWPAALWLCLQSLRACGRLVASPDIEALLAETVFASYSAEERDLLMRLSVLEDFTEQDAEALASPQSAVSLRTLREKNAFLSHDMKTGRYQFHAIFRNFLRKELARAAHIDKAPLYRLAGECCARRHELVAAFRLFSLAGRDEDLVRLLDLFLRLEEDRNTIYFAEEHFAAASAVPWRVRLQNPLGWLAFVWLYAVMWNDHRTARLLEETEERFRAAPEIPDGLKRRLRGETETIRATLVFNDVDKTLAHFVEASRLLNGPSVFCSQDSLWSFGSPGLAFLGLREPGDYLTLLEKEARVFTLYHSLSGGREKGGEAALRAEYLLELGDFARAEAALLDALHECGGNDKYLAAILSATFNLARLRLATGSPEEALRLLQELRPQVERLGVSELFEGFDMAAGYLNAVLGRVRAIPQWLRDGDVFTPPHNAVPQVFGFSLTVHAKSLLLQEDYRRLARVAEKIPEAAPIRSLYARIHGKALRAMAAWHAQDRAGALPPLREALALARPDAMTLSLAEYGDQLLPLLKHLRRSQARDPHLAAVLSLAGRVAHVAGTAPLKNKRGLLTPREQELMQHVVAGHSNPAIAAILGVSRDAVKKILSSAYAKLGAKGRFDAAQRFVALYKQQAQAGRQ